VRIIRGMSVESPGRTPTPPRAAAQFRVPLLLRHARPEDCDALTEIANAAKRVWGYPERWLEHWSPQLTVTPELLARTRTIVAEVRDSIVGFASAELRGRRAYLEHMWVVPRAMRNGVGRALYDAIVEQAREAGAAYLLVESDPNAEAFYTRLGAVRIGSTHSTVDGERRTLPLLRLEL
jgi:ribosomal protein S18 acetylase RimI-like enzyme